MSQLGDLLKRLRGKKSLREASKLTGISHNYLSIVERGVDPRSGAPVSPTPETLKKLSEAYNFDYEELMIRAGYLNEQAIDDRDPVDKLISYLEADLNNDEIRERMTFIVDDMTLSEEDVDEFIAFVRAKRAMKKVPPVSAAKTEGH